MHYQDSLSVHIDVSINLIDYLSIMTAFVGKISQLHITKCRL